MINKLLGLFRNTLHRAFVNWAEVSSLRFIEVPVESKIQADLNISFLKGKHNDRLPFDGPGIFLTNIIFVVFWM